jgi:hypothetical protein
MRFRLSLPGDGLGEPDAFAAGLADVAWCNSSVLRGGVGVPCAF